MMGAVREAEPAPIRLTCPSCGRFLATVSATYVECPPCKCGVQTTIRLAGRRARALVELPSGTIEVKGAR